MSDRPITRIQMDSSQKPHNGAAAVAAGGSPKSQSNNINHTHTHDKLRMSPNAYRTRHCIGVVAE